jgi:multiple sugar transport system substrate-binding protein
MASLTFARRRNSKKRSHHLTGHSLPFRPRIHSGLAALVGLALVVAACSPPEDVGGGGGGASSLDFTVWSYSIETIQDNIERFEQENSGVTVNLEDHSFFDYHDIMATKFTGGNPPDVEYSSDHWLDEWVAAGWIAPLEDHCPAATEYKDEWAPYATEGMTLDGKLYGLPYYSDLLIFIYNEKMLREAGFDSPPETWEELAQQAQTMKEKGIVEYPINIPLTKADPWTIEIFYSMVYSMGGHMFDENDEPVFNEPGSEAETALQWLADARNEQEILDPASVEVAEPDVVKTTGAGQAAFTVMAKYNLAELNLGNHEQKGNFKMALMPGSTHSTVGFVRFYALSAATVEEGEEKIQAACDFLNYFGGKTDGEYKVVKRWALEKGLGFANLPLYEDAEIQEAIDSWGDAGLESEQAEIAQTKEGLTSFWGTWDIYAREQINGAVGGQVSVQEALQNMADRWAQLKEEQG